MKDFKYEVFKIRGKKFVVKLDLNPLTNEYEYHMYIRHLITPEQAISAYFSKTYEVFNKEYNRYELYSASLDITVYYMYLKEQDIFLITAFYKADCRQSAECFCEAKHADTFNAGNQEGDTK